MLSVGGCQVKGVSTSEEQSIWLMNCYIDELKYLPPSSALHSPTTLSACARRHSSFLGSPQPRNLESFKNNISTVWWIKSPVFVCQTSGCCGRKWPWFVSNWTFGGLLHFLLNPINRKNKQTWEYNTEVEPRSCVAHLPHNSCTEEGTDSELQNSPASTRIRKHPNHIIVKTINTVGASISIQHLSALTHTITQRSNPVIHKVTHCKGKTNKKQTNSQQEDFLCASFVNHSSTTSYFHSCDRTDFFTLTLDLLPGGVWLTATGCWLGADDWRFIMIR